MQLPAPHLLRRPVEPGLSALVRVVEERRGRTGAMEGEHAALRHLVRETGRHPVAAVDIAECWPTTGGTAAGRARPGMERSETLALWGTTPSAGITRIAEIGRVGNAGGSGVVGEATTVPLDVRCPLLDGLLAAPIESRQQRPAA